MELDEFVKSNDFKDLELIKGLVSHVKGKFTGRKPTKFNNFGEVLSALYGSYIRSCPIENIFDHMLDDMPFVISHLKQYQMATIRQAFDKKLKSIQLDQISPQILFKVM